MDREAIEDMLETMLIGDSDQGKLRRLLVDYEREMQRLRKENEWLKKVLEDCEKKRVDEKSGRVVDMTKPQPSSEFCYLKTLDWVAEISKKTNEVVQEAGYLGGLVDDSFIETDIEDVGVTEKRLALKLTEVITFCTSWLNRIGYLEDERDEMQRYVNEKNRKRGCLEE